ncbi:MAG TPA: type II toxin-antitoxin system VapC family toxin [Ktedonobacterales bacterium]|jgi:hypothetical protein
MATYFLDTSALVKRQVAEIGHTWVKALCRPGANHTIVISELAEVEVIASFCRMVRETPPRLDITTRDRFITRFRQQVRRRYLVIPVDRTVITRAATLCRVRPLRAYDAVQLACALVLRDDNLAAGQPVPTFVCADTTLLSAAAAEGLRIENPNDHP